MSMADGSGVSATGTVSGWSASVRGMTARAVDAAIFNRTPITGSPDTMTTVVTGYKRDFSTVDLSADAATTYVSSAPARATVSAVGVISAGDQPGAVTVTVNHSSFSSTARFVNHTAGSYEVNLTDTELATIGDSGGAVQTSGIVARVNWSDGGTGGFKQDITGTLTYVPPAGVTYDPAKKIFSGTTPGSYQVKAEGAGGNTIDTVDLVVNPSGSASCTGLTVIPACDLTMEKLDPSTPSAQLGKLNATVSVNAYMSTYGATCQTQVYANYSDGSRALMTGSTDVIVTSQNTSIVTSSATGLLTATGEGNATVQASWTVAGTELCNGTAQVKVDLPAATSITVTPTTASVALSATDPAATIKGLPTTQAMQVQVNYADGTVIDFTNHPSTTYDASLLDPSDLLSITSSGTVSATGTGTGTAKILAQVGVYGSLSPGEASITVVGADGLSANVYEPYTPTPPRVADTTFSLIEGTSTYQDGTYEVVMTFSDASTQDITNNASTVVTVNTAGTTTPNAGVVTFDPATAKVTAVADGQVDVTFSNTSFVTQITGFTVNSTNESITVLSPTIQSGPTFSGIKDQGTTKMDVVATFADNTRRRLHGDRFITGLLEFNSSNASAATIAASGVATIKGNESTVIGTKLASALDSAPAYGPQEETAVDCNLTPDCGDLDLGDTVGLAFKDQAPGAEFAVNGRINTCTQKLGSFDVELTYDPLVLEVQSVEAIGASAGQVFNSNALSTPGKIFINGVMNPDSPPSAGLQGVFRVNFKATGTGGAKGGDGISDMGGTVKTVLAIDETAIGAATPRALVAGEGKLDPNCSTDPVYGDANDDCSFNAGDPLFLQIELAKNNPPVLTAAQKKKADAYPDGQITIADVVFMSRVLARLSHFIKLEVKESINPAANADFLVNFYDRDQNPVTEQALVFTEVNQPGA